MCPDLFRELAHENPDRSIESIFKSMTNAIATHFLLLLWNVEKQLLLAGHVYIYTMNETEIIYRMELPIRMKT